MKRSALTLVPVMVFVNSMILSSCGNAGGTGKTGLPASVSQCDTASIFFNEYEHDFGKVTAGEKTAYVFTFENRGNAPLVISSATPSCGCTVSKYSKKPVAPGGTGSIEVIFDSSGRNGRQTKTITVMSNATKPVVMIRITGEVL
jgi:Protein of unknown function (DUF1573)